MSELFPVNQKIGLFEKYKHVVLIGESLIGEFSSQEENIKTCLRVQATKFGDGVAVAASDISEGKEQEEAFRRSRALLERTGEVAGTGGLCAHPVLYPGREGSSKGRAVKVCKRNSVGRHGPRGMWHLL